MCAFTPDSRALWLALARQGGWWTVEAIVQFWKPTFYECEVRDIVRALLAGRFLVSREANPGEVSYAVTSECAPLPGVDGTLVERSDGTSEFRTGREAHSPTALAYIATLFHGSTT